MDRLVAFRIHFGVPDASSRTHALREPGVNDPMIPFRVLMLQLAVQHPRHDFHVLVGMRPKSRVRPYEIIIVNQQQPVVGIGRVIMMPEAEAVSGLEPTRISLKAVCLAPDLDGFISLNGHDGYSFLPHASYQIVLCFNSPLSV